VVGDFIGAGAAQEEAIVGETSNLAARLQALAEPRAVVIGWNQVDRRAVRISRSRGRCSQGHRFAKNLPAWQVLGAGTAKVRALVGGKLATVLGFLSIERDVVRRCVALHDADGRASKH